MTGSLDFSASGSPITFGLLAANSTGPGGGQYTSTQEYRNWTLTIVPAGLFSTFGYGCQGSTGVTSTMGNDNFPGLGFQNFRMNLSNAPGSTLATLVLGFSQLATPVPGAWFGAPGCDLLISPDIVHCWVVTGASGTASSWPIPIPSQAASLGQTFYGQWLVFDTPANPLGITTSNGGAATIQ